MLFGHQSLGVQTGIATSLPNSLEMNIYVYICIYIYIYIYYEVQFAIILATQLVIRNFLQVSIIYLDVQKQFNLERKKTNKYK